jgi:membrane associated rhomboid family serine protease
MNQPGASLPPPTLPRCYRHPDRETGRQCTRCGTPACADCLQTASVGSHCLECVKAAKPDVATRVRFWNARQPTLVTYALIAVNLVIYVWTVTAGSSRILCQEGSVAAVTDRATCNLALVGPFVENGDWYRIISSGFLHFSPFHILMNMLLLFQLGQMLEPALGRTRFGLLYLASLLGGSAAVLVMQPDAFTGGASGAVFGLMGAAAVGLHRRGVNVFSTGIGTTLILNLVITFTIPGISIGGHLGGAAAGALCGFVLLAPRLKPGTEWQTYAVPALVSVAAIVISVLSVS